MPHVLITGGLGFVGGACVRAFSSAGWRVDVCDDLSNNTYQPGTLPTGVEWACGAAEVFSRLRVSTASIPDLVVHCASPVGAAGVLQWRGRLANEIISTTHSAAVYCASNDVPLINISTSEVYGFSGVYHEHDDLRVPPHVSARIEYAVGKLAAETAVRLLPRLKGISIRPFNVVGADQRSRGGFVLPTFAEQAVEGRPLTVYGDGTQQRAFLGVGDLAAFILHTTTCENVYDRRVYNVGNPWNATTINDLAQRVLHAVQDDGAVCYTDGKAVHGDDYEEAEGHVKLPEISRALNLGWRPAQGLEDLVLEAVEKARAGVRLDAA